MQLFSPGLYGQLEAVSGWNVLVLLPDIRVEMLFFPVARVEAEAEVGTLL